MGRKKKIEFKEKEIQDFQFIPEQDKATVRAFKLKNHEITMAAKAEIEKLQTQLLFVSMSDYNKVVDENKQLRKYLKKLTEKENNSILKG